MSGDFDARFLAAVSGSELDDLRVLGDHVPRPELRKPRRKQAVGYQVTASLNDSEPRIWRTLEIRCDVGLDLVHQIVQAAFGWNDSHLHMFAIGGEPFDQKSQAFLCPSDVVEGEVDGIPEQEVRLDETLAEPGDELHYVYDYGDHWDVTLRLDEVLPEAGELAGCVAGERAAPPDDCGSRRTAEALAEVLEDPAHFDIADVNARLHDPLLVLHDSGLNADLVKLLQQLRFEPAAAPLLGLASDLRDEGQRLSVDDFDEFLRPIQWFLQRARGEGIPLTSSGYLRSEDVQAACAVVPNGYDWPGSMKRESQTPPVLRFREALQRLGLLRKSKGRLVLTKAGARGLVESGFLWGHIASRLIPDKPRFDRDAALLTLLWATGTSVFDDVLPAALEALGWCRSDGEPLDSHDLLYAVPALDALSELAADRRGSWELITRGPAVRALAREALFWEA